jgi:hypothetical protein
MKKIAIILAMVLAWSSAATANEIYIEQVGSGLDLDIVQDGEDNQIGNSTTGAILEGADMTFSITQTGNYNTIAATIKGATYTGLWNILGNSNAIDLQCSSTSTGNCDTVTLDIDIDGSDTTFDFDIGETADATSSDISFTIDGNGNVVEMTVDGQSAQIDVVVDNTSSGAVSPGTNGTLTAATATTGNVIDIDVDGDGDVVGHTIDLTITGGGSYYNITQSGINDNHLDATFSGDNQAVDITQSD